MSQDKPQLRRARAYGRRLTQIAIASTVAAMAFASLRFFGGFETALDRDNLLIICCTLSLCVAHCFIRLGSYADDEVLRFEIEQIDENVAKRSVGG